MFLSCFLTSGIMYITSVQKILLDKFCFEKTIVGTIDKKSEAYRETWPFSNA